MACSYDDKAARLQGVIDAIYGRDNGDAVAEAFDIKSQLGYAARHAAISLDITPELASPGTKGIRQWLLGDIAGMSHRPNEVLGDDIANPVLKAYEDYAKRVAGENATGHMLEAKEGQLNPDRLVELKEDSGVYDAVDEARALIEERFANDPDRLQYGRKWLEARIEGKGDNGEETAGLVRQAGSNLTKNLLVNNLRSGVLNHVQLATTTYPEFGIQATRAGEKAYKAAVKAKNPELEFIGGGRFYDQTSPLDKFDFFNRPEHRNQGVTYYTAKLKALKEGKGEEAAREIGRAAIEKTQFKSRLGNEPRAYWGEGGKTRLSLLSYSIQMKRLHNGWLHGLADGIVTRNADLVKKNGQALAYFALANAAINGVTADIPEEVAWPIKLAFPRFYNALRQADRVSLTGLLDMDTAELSRIPLTNAGFLLKVPVLYDKLSDTLDKANNLMHHFDSPKAWLKAMQQASLLMPAIPIIGNKNAGNIAEWAYRLTTGDYERYTLGGKRYETSPGSETLRLITGKGYGEAQQAAAMDTR